MLEDRLLSQGKVLAGSGPLCCLPGILQGKNEGQALKPQEARSNSQRSRIFGPIRSLQWSHLFPGVARLP